MKAKSKFSAWTKPSVSNKGLIGWSGIVQVQNASNAKTFHHIPVASNNGLLITYPPSISEVNVGLGNLTLVQTQNVRFKAGWYRNDSRGCPAHLLSVNSVPLRYFHAESQFLKRHRRVLQICKSIRVTGKNGIARHRR